MHVSERKSVYEPRRAQTRNVRRLCTAACSGKQVACYVLFVTCYIATCYLLIVTLLHCYVMPCDLHCYLLLVNGCLMLVLLFITCSFCLLRVTFLRVPCHSGTCDSLLHCYLSLLYFVICSLMSGRDVQVRTLRRFGSLFKVAQREAGEGSSHPTQTKYIRSHACL